MYYLNLEVICYWLPAHLEPTNLVEHVSTSVFFGIKIYNIPFDLYSLKYDKFVLCIAMLKTLMKKSNI